MGKSKSTAKIDQKNDPTAYAKPHIDAAAATLRPGYDAAVAQNALLMPRVTQALDYSGDVLSGKYLAGNPHLQGVLDSTNRDISTGVNSQFSRAGRYGSGAHTGVLARAIAENENRLRYGDYVTERGYQHSAPGQIAGMTGIASALPQAAGSTYADQVRALLGGYTHQTGTTTQTQKQSPFATIGQVMQVAAQAAPLFSDRRLKREIQKIGELADGLGIYVWRYLWGEPSVGVMADEVAVKRPWALGPDIGGFATVNYGAL